MLDQLDVLGYEGLYYVNRLGEVCHQIISPPAMVNGGYMDSLLRFSKKN